MQVSELKTIIAAYLARDTTADLTVDGEDLGIAALNSAARKAQQAHDFKAAEIDVSLIIGSGGNALANSFVNTTATVTGTLSPNINLSVFTVIGTYLGAPLYRDGSNTYYLSYNGVAWHITANGFSLSPGAWFRITTSLNPSGAYTALGTYTGVVTVTSSTAAVAIKRVKFVSLPLNSGEYEPVEFLGYEEFSSRVRRRIGRQPFNATKTLTQLGASLGVNPIAVQSAQSIYLSPATLPLPITAKLLAVQWMPLYANDTDHDFFTDFGTEYMYWAGIAETNNFWKRFTEPRIEGQVDVGTIQALANDCLQRLIAWDVSIARNTTTPLAQLTPPAFSTTPPAPQQ